MATAAQLQKFAAQRCGYTTALHRGYAEEEALQVASEVAARVSQGVRLDAAIDAVAPRRKNPTPAVPAVA